MVINLSDGVKEINSIQLLIDYFSENLLACEQYFTRLLLCQKNISESRLRIYWLESSILQESSVRTIFLNQAFDTTSLRVVDYKILVSENYF